MIKVNAFLSYPIRVVYILSLLLLNFLTVFLSCDKLNNSPVPYVNVNFAVNLNIVNELNIPGTSVCFPHYGYGGVIIYCELPGSYLAFDATCTEEISSDCRLKNDGVVAECPCCGSTFILIDNGYPGKGPATIPLKQYHVSLINNFELRVYN